MGIGTRMDKEHIHILPANSFVAFSTGTAHYSFTNEETILEISGIVLPWKIVFIMYFCGFPLHSTAWPSLSRYLAYHFTRDSFASCQKDLEAELMFTFADISRLKL